MTARNRACGQCGQPLDGRQDANYCSGACRARASRERRSQARSAAAQGSGIPSATYPHVAAQISADSPSVTGPTVLRLDPNSITAVAHEIATAVVAELREHHQRRPCLDAAAVADWLGVNREWVYRRAAELGGQRLGNGPRAPLRFDPEAVEKALVPCSAGRGSRERTSRASKPKVTSPSPRAMGTGARLLPIKDRSGASGA